MLFGPFNGSPKGPHNSLMVKYGGTGGKKTFFHFCVDFFLCLSKYNFSLLHNNIIGEKSVT